MLSLLLLASAQWQEPDCWLPLDENRFWGRSYSTFDGSAIVRVTGRPERVERDVAGYLQPRAVRFVLQTADVLDAQGELARSVTLVVPVLSREPDASREFEIGARLLVVATKPVAGQHRWALENIATHGVYRFHESRAEDADEIAVHGALRTSAAVLPRSSSTDVAWAHALLDVVAGEPASPDRRAAISLLFRGGMDLPSLFDTSPFARTQEPNDVTDRLRSVAAELGAADKAALLGLMVSKKVKGFGEEYLRSLIPLRDDPKAFEGFDFDIPTFVTPSYEEQWGLRHTLPADELMVMALDSKNPSIRAYLANASGGDLSLETKRRIASRLRDPDPELVELCVDRLYGCDGDPAGKPEWKQGPKGLDLANADAVVAYWTAKYGG